MLKLGFHWWEKKKKIHSEELREEKFARQKEWHLQAQYQDMVGWRKLLSVFIYFLVSPTWLSSLRMSSPPSLAQGGFGRHQTRTLGSSPSSVKGNVRRPLKSFGISEILWIIRKRSQAEDLISRNAWESLARTHIPLACFLCGMVFPNNKATFTNKSTFTFIPK